jgi:hypothetical protein
MGSTINIVYEVENVGNTPALNVSIRHNLEQEIGNSMVTPSGILPAGDQVDLKIVDATVQVAPKDRRNIKIKLPVDSSQLTHVLEHGLIETCVYSDVFGASHRIEWTCNFASCTDPREIR